MSDFHRPPVLEETGEFLQRRQNEYRDLRVLVAGEPPSVLDEPSVTQTFAFDVQPDHDLAAALLQKKGQDVALVPIAGDCAPELDLLERLNEICPGTVKVVLGTTDDPAALFRAVQRGVVDYLLPATSNRAELEIVLASAIERAVRDRAATGLLTEVSRDREELARKMESSSQALYRARGQVDRMKVTDSDTGLYGNAYFKTTWRREMARSVRYGRSLALMVLDIDLETPGEDLSIELLRAAGTFLLESIRDVDFVARFRDEGFAMILPECNKSDALELAERLRERFGAEGSAGPLADRTVTIAVAACPEDESSAPAMIDAADSALRSAMSSGRNQVIPA